MEDLFDMVLVSQSLDSIFYTLVSIFTAMVIALFMVAYAVHGGVRSALSHLRQEFRDIRTAILRHREAAVRVHQENGFPNTTDKVVNWINNTYLLHLLIMVAYGWFLGVCIQAGVKSLWIATPVNVIMLGACLWWSKWQEAYYAKREAESMEFMKVVSHRR